LLNSEIISEFKTDLSKSKITTFLKNNKIKRFDLVIMDRVCYILDDQSLQNILSILSQNTKYIYIDDFFLNDDNFLISRKNLYGYKHTNFDFFLEKLNFKKINYDQSPYKKVFMCNTRSALYEFVK